VQLDTGDPLFLLGIPIFGYGGAFALRVMSNPAFMQWVSKEYKLQVIRGFDGVLEHLLNLVQLLVCLMKRQQIYKSIFRNNETSFSS
jgi:hypothetical protein